MRSWSRSRPSSLFPLVMARLDVSSLDDGDNLEHDKRPFCQALPLCSKSRKESVWKANGGSLSTRGEFLPIEPMNLCSRRGSHRNNLPCRFPSPHRMPARSEDPLGRIVGYGFSPIRRVAYLSPPPIRSPAPHRLPDDAPVPPIPSCATLANQGSPHPGSSPTRAIPSTSASRLEKVAIFVLQPSLRQSSGLVPEFNSGLNGLTTVVAQSSLPAWFERASLGLKGAPAQCLELITCKRPEGSACEREGSWSQGPLGVTAPQSLGA